MAKTALYVLTILGVCTIAPLQYATAQQLGFGIHSYQSLQVIDNQLTSNGLSFRTDVSWEYIETQKGVLTFPERYAQYDSLAASLAQKGNQPLIILDYGNKFYGCGADGQELPTSAEAVQGFANYARFVVNHYKGSVDQFEVYNEWNGDITSTIQPHVGGDPVAYVTLLRATYEAIKATNPNGIVVGGAVGGTDTTWVKKFIAAGGLNYLDAFSVHPYVFKNAVRPAAPGSVTLSFIPTAGAADIAPIPGTPEDSIAWLDQVELLVAQGAPGRNIPIYVSEIGWSTYTTGYGITEAAEAAYVQRFLLLAHARPWLAKIWWYDLIDGAADPTVLENRFGLLHVNGDPKPGFTAFVQAQQLMQTKGTLVQKSNSDEVELVVGHDASPKNFCAVWLPTNDFNVSRSASTVSSLTEYGCRAAAAPAPALGALPVFLNQ